jgi:alkyl sulfatase BDS1-like metallo-beta-lactamase superfamily hydrolase
MIGGVDRVIERGRAALADRDAAWAAELADYVLVNAPAHVEARRLKAGALSELGERQINAIARNYYLTAAQALLKDLPPQ